MSRPIDRVLMLDEDSQQAALNGNRLDSLIAKVGGYWAGRDLQTDFQGEVAGLLNRSQRSFPGAQPVSFSLRHLTELKHEDYFVCEKTDGIRYLLYMTADEGRPVTYFIDRKNDYYWVQDAKFPHQSSDDFSRYHSDTILDGELVEDRYHDRPSEIKFLVFDCLVLDKQDLRHRPLDKRLAYFKEHVLKPYQKMVARHPEFRGPFTLEDKANEFSYGLEKMFKETIPRVKQLHGNDGLIFTCKNSDYHSGTDPHILKWKPPGENTVDFLLHIVWPQLPPDPDDSDQSPQEDYLADPEAFELYVFYGNKEYQFQGDLYVTPQEWAEWKSLNRPLQDSIVECYQEIVPALNGVNGAHHGDGAGPTRRWRFHRFRDDKHEANHISTFESVIESIEDHVTEDDLLKHQDEIRSCWKTRDAQRKVQPKPTPAAR